MAEAQDRPGNTVELGPRSLALLRRLVLALEALAGGELPDPGKSYEDEAAVH